MGRGIVKIGTKMVDMLANAASPVIYRRIFHKDFLLQMDPKKGEIDTNALMEMGFVMSLQTTMEFKDILNKVTQDDYIDWLTQFEALDVMMAVGEIFALFKGQEKTLVSQKKRHRKRSGNQRPHS